jgi:hypothetical protein
VQEGSICKSLFLVFGRFLKPNRQTVHIQNEFRCSTRSNNHEHRDGKGVTFHGYNARYMHVHTHTHTHTCFCNGGEMIKVYVTFWS